MTEAHHGSTVGAVGQLELRRGWRYQPCGHIVQLRRGEETAEGKEGWCGSCDCWRPMGRQT